MRKNLQVCCTTCATVSFSVPHAYKFVEVAHVLRVFSTIKKMKQRIKKVAGK